MSEKEFFSISGVGSAKHTPETKKKWYSLPDDRPKSDYGKQSILDFAKDKGFQRAGENINPDAIKEAFNFLQRKLFPDGRISGSKSYIIREAIIRYLP